MTYSFKQNGVGILPSLVSLGVTRSCQHSCAQQQTNTTNKMRLLGLLVVRASLQKNRLLGNLKDPIGFGH